MAAFLDRQHRLHRHPRDQRRAPWPRWRRGLGAAPSLDDLLALDERARAARRQRAWERWRDDHHRAGLPAHAGHADRRPRVRPLPRGGGLRRQGAALLGRLRPRAVAPPARARQPPSSCSRALPLGGYVRMLDEREGAGGARASCAVPSTASRWRGARPSSPPGRWPTCCWRCCCIAAAHWIGIDEPKAVLGAPVAGSLAERAGLRAGDWVRAVSRDGSEWTDVRSMTDLRWQVTQAALRRRAAAAAGQRRATAAAARTRRRSTCGGLGTREVDAALMRAGRPGRAFQRAGAWARSRPAGPAARPACAAGDRVLAVDGRAVDDAQTCASASAGGARRRRRSRCAGRSSATAGALDLEVLPRVVERRRPAHRPHRRLRRPPAGDGDGAARPRGKACGRASSAPGSCRR